MTIQSLAQEMSAAFETRTRAAGTAYDVLRDGSPEWMHGVCRDAHAGMFPDDWRYRMIRAAVDAIAEGDDPDDPTTCADAFVPVYTGDRLSWASSHLDRTAYVDNAIEDFGHHPDGFAGDIALGIFTETSEVFSLVAQALSDIADSRNDDTETEGN